MQRIIPGSITIPILMLLAVGIVDFQLFQFSFVAGLCYAIVTPLLFLHTMYRICRKCPHASDDTCRHVVFGRVVSRWFKVSKPSPYTKMELLSMGFSNILYFLVPQYWLFQNLLLFILFWIALISAIIILRLRKCVCCRNTNCPFYGIGR